MSPEHNCLHGISECHLGNRVFAKVVSKDKVILDEEGPESNDGYPLRAGKGPQRCTQEKRHATIVAETAVKEPQGREWQRLLANTRS